MKTAKVMLVAGYAAISMLFCACTTSAPRKGTQEENSKALEIGAGAVSDLLIQLFVR